MFCRNLFFVYYFLIAITLANHPGEASSLSPPKLKLSFTLPFDRSNYNEIHLFEAAGGGGAAAVAYWTTDEQKGIIRVALATTQRYVALGFNPSTPAMTGSDIVSCSRENDGQVVARDYFATSYGTPKQDDINDWTVVASGSMRNIDVWCELSRPLTTCDPSEDFQLYDLGASVSGLLAFGTDANRADMHYHGMNRRFVNFVFDEEALTAEHTAKPTSETRFEHVITSPISTVPHDSTGAEICSYHRLPDRMRGAKHHVVDVQFSQPITQAQAAGLTHHTILYGCAKDVDGAVDGAEIDCAKTWEFCGSDWLGGRLIRANEGVPVGRDIVVATILLRHFYNPNLLKGYQDQNRWKISYTPNLRPHEPVEIQFQTTFLNIPALKTSTTAVYMPGECTQRVGKITIEAIRHHMHDYGVSGRLRHIRDNQELAPVHVMESFTRGVSEGWVSVHRQILPGDMLIYECTYRNTLDQTVIWGERREDEMCVIALKTKGTNISNAISFVPKADKRDPSSESYRFVCQSPQWMDMPSLPSILIPKKEFEARLAAITPYTKPTCPSAGPTPALSPRAVPNACPPGFKQPTTASECRAANPAQAASMIDCSQWGKDQPNNPAPRCFSHMSAGAFCWKGNGAEQTAWGKTLVWCLPEGYVAAPTTAAPTTAAPTTTAPITAAPTTAAATTAAPPSGDRGERFELNSSSQRFVGLGILFPISAIVLRFLDLA